MKEKNEKNAIEKRKSSFALKNDLHSSNPILYCLDFLLSWFVLPLNGSAFWVTVDYLYLYKIKNNDVPAVLCVCVIFFIFLHVASKSIYRFVLKYISESKVQFFIVARAYIYMSAVCGVILCDGVEFFWDGSEWAQDICLNIVAVVLSFVILFSMKCSLHLAGCSAGDVGHESTPEEVFLFPFRIFQCSVLFTEHVGNKFIYLFSSRLYTEIFGIASVSSWYGIWTAFDSIAGANTRITIIVVILSYVCLFCTKTVRNITASPFAIITDRKQGYFDVPTLYQWSFHWKKNKLLYLLDSIFSVFIVGMLVILVWRGAWCILDRVIYPDSNDQVLSAWVSLFIGYALVIITFMSQPLMKRLLRKYIGWKRLIFLDMYIVVSFCGTINVWRGIWMLLEKFIDLETSLWNCLALHFFSFSILVIFNASNTLLVRGVYIDADDSGDECVEFPCYYFRLHFQAKQKEKTLEELDNKLNTQQILQNLENTDDNLPNCVDSFELTTEINEKLSSTPCIRNEDDECENDPVLRHDNAPSKSSKT